MKITRFDIHRFSLPLKQPLKVGKRSSSERAGIIVELENDHGHVAFGETAPLPGLSHETLQKAEEQLFQLRQALLHTDIPEDLTGSSDGFESWLEHFRLAPSVRFGLESGLLGLIAADQDLAPLHFLCATPRKTVTVNGLLAGTREQILDEAARLMAEGFRAFKLKVGRQTVAEDIAAVRALRDLISDEAVLRLDANRSWTRDQALPFAEAVSERGIDYIEEPVKTWTQLKELLSRQQFALPVALDESLTDIAPKNAATLSPTAIKAVVIKPMLFGVERAIRLAKEAARHGMAPVISATFETSIGLGFLATLAASVSQEDIPAGLGTLDWFTDDLLEVPMIIENGSVKIDKHLNPSNSIRRDLLTPCAHV